VLTTTLIHHQHYFPVEDEHGKLKNAFLAVINTEPDHERTIARNAERVVSARLRDAQFFWEADRKSSLESRVDRLATLVFQKKLGSYKEKSLRIEKLARWIAKEEFGAPDETANHAATAARLSKADLATDMVREFPELQGIMGGVYARTEGYPEEVWKAIYYQYLPIGVEADAPPTEAQLGRAAMTWAAVSLADKLDTVVGLFAAGEKPTGSRDPYGIRRAAQGIVKILADLQGVGVTLNELDLFGLVQKAFEPHASLVDGSPDGWRQSPLSTFLWERAAHLFEKRGFKAAEIRVVEGVEWANIRRALRRLEAVSKASSSDDFKALAALFKRVKNITKGVEEKDRDLAEVRTLLREPAELALLDQLVELWPRIYSAQGSGNYTDALREFSKLRSAVDRFFVDVLVMADDQRLREARLALLTRMRTAVLKHIGDISAIAPDESVQA
jgi:glycyl-tRNA synthetase beta chain